MSGGIITCLALHIETSYASNVILYFSNIYYMLQVASHQLCHVALNKILNLQKTLMVELTK